jgi:hypothetical protein
MHVTFKSPWWIRRIFEMACSFFWGIPQLFYNGHQKIKYATPSKAGYPDTEK